MALYATLKAAMDSKDFETMAAHYHPDYQFVRHQANVTLSLDDWRKVAIPMMSHGNWQVHESRCLYENDDILVVHNIITFPDGSSEAVMGVHTLKDGKIIRTETGATPLDR